MNAEIFHILRERIVDGFSYKSGTLPSELTLKEEFGVSRHTVRAALQKLVDEGLIERRRGAGTSIIERDQPKQSWAIASLDPFVSQKYDGDILSASPMVSGLFPNMAKLFGLRQDQTLFVAPMIFRSEGVPIAFSMIFTRTEFGERIPRDEIGKEYFLNLLERYCGLRATRARQRTSAAMPSTMVCDALGIPVDVPILVLDRSYYSASGELFEHAKVHVAGNAHPQVFDFFRDDNGANASVIEVQDGNRINEGGS